jgi:hypothetical protein
MAVEGECTGVGVKTGDSIPKETPVKTEEKSMSMGYRMK